MFPTPEHRRQNRSISLDEFYAGDCPPTMDPATLIPLDLATLGSIAAVYIRERGHIPALMAPKSKVHVWVHTNLPSSQF
ncbi:hypothetical protein L873DRAFT_682470 [Choiromyces venosus 120613-1]|uniref:Uncharacterized protein n=1 Tax=Choiromyces venosus 120613-1 TaxID=1336337 RepID=A0A3N4ITN5_9PEZI|nr:hypothetical protein L873DRAFT_682470 [Choiromyces venosus 120613-1]